jgi:hypothetical protein
VLLDRLTHHVHIREVNGDSSTHIRADVNAARPLLMYENPFSVLSNPCAVKILNLQPAYWPTFAVPYLYKFTAPFDIYELRCPQPQLC